MPPRVIRKPKLSFDDQLQADIRFEQEQSLKVPARYFYLAQGLNDALESKIEPVEDALDYLEEPVPNIKSIVSSVSLEPTTQFDNILNSMATILTFHPCGCEEHINWAMYTGYAWVPMSSWTNYLLEIYVLRGLKPQSERAKAFQHRLIVLAENLCHVPQKFSRFNRAMREIDLPDIAFSSVPSLLPQMTRLSIHLASIDHPWYMTTWMKVYEDAEQAQAIKPAFEDMLRKGYDLAEILVSRLGKIQKELPKIDFLTIRADVEMINDCMDHLPADGVFRSMLSKRLARVIGEAIVAIASQAYLSTDDAEPLTAYSLEQPMWLLSVLGRVVKIGHSFVAEVLDTHFPIALVQLAVLPDNGDSEMREQLDTNCQGFGMVFKAIKPYLVFRSVLNRIIREMKTIQDSELLERLGKKNPFRLALDDVMKEAQRLKQIQREFDACKSIPTLCSVDKCWWLKPGAKIRRCSGCQFAIYCSRQCQRLDWERGHREKCKHYERLLNGLSYRPSQLDQLFLKFLIQYEIRTRPVRIPNSMARLAKFRAETVIQFDFTVSPLSVSYTTPAKVLEAVEKRSLSWGKGMSKKDHEMAMLIVKERMAKVQNQVLEEAKGNGDGRRNLVVVNAIYPATFFDNWLIFAEGC